MNDKQPDILDEVESLHLKMLSIVGDALIDPDFMEFAELNDLVKVVNDIGRFRLDRTAATAFFQAQEPSE